MRILLLFVFTVAAFGQSASIIRVTPSTSGTPAVGEVRWQELFANGQNYVGIKASNTLAASYSLTLPIAAPATTGDCLTGTTAGVLSFAACGGYWTLTGSDIYRATGNVGIGVTPAHKLDVLGTSAKIYAGGTTTDTTLHIGNSDVASPGQGGFLIFHASAATPYFSINTLSQGVAYRNISLASLGGSVCVGCTAPSYKLAVSGTLGVTGTATIGSHILTTSPSNADIGDATNYFQTLYVENIDAAPAGIANSYLRARKFELFDINGSAAAFWDQRVNATSVTSAWTLRDNAGSRALQFYRQFASSAANHVSVFGELRPAKRATVDGDAVNDSVYPELGNTTARWANVWAAAGSFSGTVAAGTSFSAPNVYATTAFSGGVDGVTVLGSSSVRMSKLWSYDLSATGTVQLGASSTVGYVWTASNTVGNGGWAAVSAGAGAVLTTTNQEVEGFKYFGVSGSDRAVIYRSADNIMGLQTMLDGQTDPTTYAYGGVNNALVLQPRAGIVGIGAVNGSYTLNVAGTLGVTGAATLSGGATFGAALAASATDTHDIGSATRFRNIYGKTVNAENLEVANSTFVTTFWRHSLASASSYRIASGSGGQIEVQMSTTSSTASDAGFRGTLYPLDTTGSNGDLGFSGTPWRYLYLSTGMRLTTGAAAGRVLTSDASGNGTWVAPAGGGSVSSIATSSPISGGTITTTGTISCPTCYTTSAGALSGSITFSAGSTYSIGASGTRVSNIFSDAVTINGGLTLNSGASITAPDGNSGVSATVTVRDSAGTGTCTLVFSEGLLTGGTC